MSRRRRSVTLAEVAAMPEADLRFAHFAALRSGRDRYSGMSLAALRMAVGEDAADCVESEVPDPARLASALRWMLRGLPIARAIRKARVDAEVSMRALATAQAHARRVAEYESRGLDPSKYLDMPRRAT